MTGKRHLHDLVEFIFMNVGGCYDGVKASHPPIHDSSVGGFIVVGGEESSLQGEGSQGVDVPQYLLPATVR